MENINLEQAIQQYNTALTELENLVQSPSPAQVIEVLIARDRVNSVLEMLATSVNYPPLSAQSLEEISKIDTRLKAKTQAIALFTESTSFRASFHPKEQAWWWFLEAPKTAWSDRFDWLCSGVSVTCLTVSLGLIGDISPRFLTGVPDAFGAVTVSTQSILTLLVAGGALTKIGQESLKSLLKAINIPEKYWHELGAVTSFLVVLGLFGFRQFLPQIATNFYTNPGMESRKKGDWSSAEEQFNRAIKLNADDAQAHFQLGNLYEDMQMIEKARPEYQLAIQGGIIGATNNLARLNIFKKDYSGAVSLLLKTLDTDKKQPLDSKIKHTVLKNLGWARLMQKNYPDAEAKLLEAIDLQSTLKLEKYDIADVYCLLAQVMEAQGDKKEALLKWKTCNQYANITIPEQDEWATMAQKRLNPQETRK
ncbi:MAG: tetratricopeptide repeat protein [Nostocales cyanobacterium LE14-WE4]|nr:tetratricopeptide repeat protein [Anabaena sp. 49633_E8]MCE2703558.1 tetratricopeptide repeat protein [Anabaena sp. 49633_E8]MDJ0502681.1 tetratricopeptide repeat protein [Nostocales cyanobacterium LE14-WE4]